MTQRVGANRSVLPAVLYVVGVVLCAACWFLTTFGLAMSTDPCLTDQCRATAQTLSQIATVVFLVTPVVAGAIMMLARPFWAKVTTAAALIGLAFVIGTVFGSLQGALVNDGKMAGDRSVSISLGDQGVLKGHVAADKPVCNGGPFDVKITGKTEFGIPITLQIISPIHDGRVDLSGAGPATVRVQAFNPTREFIVSGSSRDTNVLLIDSAHRVGSVDLTMHETGQTRIQRLYGSYECR